LVGSNTLPGQFLAGFTFPEGEIAFDGATFNRIVISSTAPDFAVDNDKKLFCRICGPKP